MKPTTLGLCLATILTVSVQAAPPDGAEHAGSPTVSNLTSGIVHQWIDAVADPNGDFVVAALRGESEDLLGSVVTKMSGQGESILWTTRIETPRAPGARLECLASDADGNILVGGSHHTNAYLAKLSGASGQTLWEQQWTSPGGATGSVRGITILGADLLARGAFGDETFVERRSGATGQIVWTLGHDVGAMVAAPNADAILGGRNESVAFVARRTGADGTEVWRQDVGGGRYVRSVAMDPAGNVYATGEAVTGVTPQHGITSTSFFTKLSGETGDLLWEKVTPPFDGVGSGTHILVDASGDVIVGSYARSFSLGHVFLNVTKYSGANGATLWQFRDIPEGPSTPVSIALDAQGNPLVWAPLGAGPQKPGAVLKLNAATGGTLWWFDTPGHSLLFGRDGAFGIVASIRPDLVVNGVDAGTGAIQWEQRLAPGPGNLAVLRIVSVDGDQVALQIGNVSSGSVTIARSTDLKDWVPVGTVDVSDEVIHVPAGTSEAAFYRILPE